MPELSDRVLRQQRLRLQRQLMSLALYALWGSMTISAALLGQITLPGYWLVIMAAGPLVTEGALSLTYVQHRNLRFRDPALTYTRCLIGMGWLFLFMWLLPAWRDALVAVMPIVVMFGIFQLNGRGISILAAIGFAGYTGIQLLDFFTARTDMTLAAIALRCGIAGGLLIWCAYFGNHVGALRARLSARNRELQDVVGEMTQLAERDHLTQAYNRRRIIDCLGQLREGALRYGRPFSVVIIDLDHFKKVNDRHGHLTGDSVLAGFASRVRSELRMLDELAPVPAAQRILGRYGGEEFIIILPHTEAVGAEQCAERIRLSTASHVFQRDLSITLSAGVATFTPDETIDSLLRRADQALYEAKHAGRNRVRIAVADQTAGGRGNDVVNLADYQGEGTA